MSGRPPAERRPAEFERAFVATRYFLGARSELTAPLAPASPVARTLEQKLELPDRQRRAEVLAGEIGLLVRALESRSFR